MGGRPPSQTYAVDSIRGELPIIEGLAADDRMKGFIAPARIPGTCDCSAFRPGFHRQPTVLRRAAMKELEDEQEWLPRSGTSAPRAVFVPQHASRCLEIRDDCRPESLYERPILSLELFAALQV